uniref:SnoaL-like domain-containing protein n=1 Tax=Bionectria ochroleuca TaxID=29856 RepID=A0A8H7KCZ0_BIOOC
MASSNTPTSDTLLSTATAYFQIFAAMDPDVISHIQSDNYTHKFGPASLNMPTRTKETFASHLKHLAGVLESFTVSIKQAWVNPSLNQVTVWAVSETKFHDHVKDNDNEEEWKFHGEYIFILDMDETGEKVKHVFEFLDSKATENLRLLAARAFKKKEEVEDK